MPKIQVNWSHVHQRIAQRVQPQHKARVQKVINDMAVLQAPAAAVGHYEWHVNVYDDRNHVVARIIARGNTIRSVYSPDMPVPSGSVNYSLTKLRQAATSQGQNTKPTQKEMSLLEEVFMESEYDRESETMEEPIPPTLRSPGVPPPPPPTRRDGRGQPPPPDDAEPPTVRLPLPRNFQSYRPSTNAPLVKRSPQPSLRREYEMPLMQEIFTEALPEKEFITLELSIPGNESKYEFEMNWELDDVGKRIQNCLEKAKIPGIKANSTKMSGDAEITMELEYMTSPTTNRNRGNKYRDAIGEALELCKKQFKVVQVEGAPNVNNTSKTSDGQIRFVDIKLIDKKTGKVVNIETKRGNSRYHTSQKQKDEDIAAHGGGATYVVRGTPARKGREL